MNTLLLSHELLVLGLGLALLMAELWTPPSARRLLAYVAVIGVLGIFGFSLATVGSPIEAQYAFNGMFVLDGFALFFKRFFLLATALVLLLAAEFSDRFKAGVGEYYSLILFALLGMLLAASANDFALLFVSLELITVTLYILVAFQRSRMSSLEAGVKYLIIGALSTSFTVFGIALVCGVAGTFSFPDLASVVADHKTNKIFLAGFMMLLAGLGFKLAAFPFQIWAPDVYQGAPSPTAAFLAVGSKAAGIVLLMRVLFTALPAVVADYAWLLMAASAATILYGNLGALPQRNLKRLLGYSSIAHAGYLLLGIAALSKPGQSAVLYYLSGYLFTVLAAFIVIGVVLRHLETEDISGLAGLNERSPLLATTMTLAMVSLAGIPPLAGFFGKFLLLKSIIQSGGLWLGLVAIAGVVVSFYYYFGVIKAIYWSKDVPDLSPIRVTWPTRVAIYACIAGMFYLGMFPGAMVRWADAAVKALRF
jgi:NADH-quinone oxidoreductase subunit N